MSIFGKIQEYLKRLKEEREERRKAREEGITVIQEEEIADSSFEDSFVVGEFGNHILRIHHVPLSKMLSYVRQAPGEVSGFFRTKITGDTIIVRDVVLLEQTGTEVSTDLNREAMQKFRYERIRKDKKTVGEWNGWFHSHPDFEPYWSGVDEGNIQSLTATGATLVSICMNRAGKMVARIDRNGQRNDLPIVVSFPIKVQIKEKCKEEVKRKVMGFGNRPNIERYHYYD